MKRADMNELFRLLEWAVNKHPASDLIAVLVMAGRLKEAVDLLVERPAKVP